MYCVPELSTKMSVLTSYRSSSPSWLLLPLVPLHARVSHRGDQGAVSIMRRRRRGAAQRAWNCVGSKRRKNYSFLLPPSLRGHFLRVEGRFLSVFFIGFNCSNSHSACAKPGTRIWSWGTVLTPRRISKPSAASVTQDLFSFLYHIRLNILKYVRPSLANSK